MMQIKFQMLNLWRLDTAILHFVPRRRDIRSAIAERFKMCNIKNSGLIKGD